LITIDPVAALRDARVPREQRVKMNNGKGFDRASFAALGCGLCLLATLSAVISGRFIFAGFTGLQALAMGGLFLAVRGKDLPPPTTPGRCSKLVGQPGFWPSVAAGLVVSLATIFLLLDGLDVLPGDRAPSPILSYIGAALGGWLSWKGWRRVIHMARTKDPPRRRRHP
jgi:hypothetical protein